MKVITFEDIQKLNLGYGLFLNWVSDAIRNKKNVILPAKISMKQKDDIFMNVMPCIIPEMNRSGAKIATRYPCRIPSVDSQIYLYDLETGRLLSIMDGNFITAVRTGSVAAHSIQLLAKEGFQSIGFVGLGNTATATLHSLMTIYPDRIFNIQLLKYKDQHISFMDKFSRYDHLKFNVFEKPEDLVSSSEVIISSATVLNQDLCAEKYFPKGCLVIPIHTRGFMNCDLAFDKIFADDTAHVSNFKNFKKFREFAEISDVVNHKVKGRTNNFERIIVYNIGIAVHDIYFASKIYEMCKDLVQEIDLKAPEEKVWLA